MHNNLVKNINLITNLIDVTLTTNHFSLYCNTLLLITYYGFTSLSYFNYY